MEPEPKTLIAVLRKIQQAAEGESSNFASLISGWVSESLAGVCVACDHRPCQTPDVCRRKSLDAMAAAKGWTMGEVLRDARAAEDQLPTPAPEGLSPVSPSAASCPPGSPERVTREEWRTANMHGGWVNEPNRGEAEALALRYSEPGNEWLVETRIAASPWVRVDGETEAGR